MMKFRWLAVTVLSLVSLTQYPADARAEDGVTEHEILIGQSTPQTGPTSVRANRIVEGAQLYFDKINASGGIHGRKLRLVAHDDAYEPAKALENTRTLLEKDKVFALFKYYGTPTIKAALPLLEQSDIPVIAPTTGAEFLRHPVQKNVFLIKEGYFAETEKLVEFAIHRGIKEIAVFYQDDAFGQDGKNGALKALASHGLKPVALGAYARNSTNIDAAYDTIKKANPKAVILFSVGKPGPEFVKKASQDKWSPLFLTGSSQVTEEFAASTKGLSEQIYSVIGLPLPDDSNYEIARAYQKDAKAAGAKLDPSAFEGYVDSLVLVEALKLAGRDLTRAGLRKAFEEKLRSKDLGGLKVAFSPSNHQGLSEVFMIHVKDGKFTPAQ